MAKSSSANGAGRLLAKRYAVALMDVAQKDNALQSVESNINSLENLLQQNRALCDAMNNPVVPSNEILAVFREIGAREKWHQLTLNFIGVLAANRRVNILANIVSAFKAEIAHRAGVVEADVRSAHALTATQEQNLVKSLSAKTGKNVKLSVTIDAALLGGMVVTIGSTMIDDSVLSKLTRLQQTMTQTKAA